MFSVYLMPYILFYRIIKDTIIVYKLSLNYTKYCIYYIKTYLVDLHVHVYMYLQINMLILYSYTTLTLIIV